MIGCFPSPHPDELFYSICARYAKRVHYHRKAAVMQELFGSGFEKGAIDLPTHLDVLIAALPPKHPYSVDRFIGEHTLLPFYRPFLPAERLRRLREEMAGENAVGIYYRFGFRKGSVKPARYLRYCPSCAMEDRIRVGETYWHRIPQLPGILVCPTHMIPLEETSVEALARRAAAPEFYTAEQAIPKQSISTGNKCWPWHNNLLALARDASWLLEQLNLTPGFQQIYRRHLTLLTENQFVLPRGKLRLGELVERYQA
ncbi:MAG TPA: TniQ family protein, partial [Ktedonobacteraceae bacterium]